MTTNKPICIWKLSENLPFNMWTRTDIGLAFDGAHVYRPESLCIAFWTKSRLVVSLPFSVTKEMPPLGESKFITWKRTKAHKKWNKINILILLITWINKKLYVRYVGSTHISFVKFERIRSCFYFILFLRKLCIWWPYIHTPLILCNVWKWLQYYKMNKKDSTICLPHGCGTIPLPEVVLVQIWQHMLNLSYCLCWWKDPVRHGFLLLALWI